MPDELEPGQFPVDFDPLIDVLPEMEDLPAGLAVVFVNLADAHNDWIAEQAIAAYDAINDRVNSFVTPFLEYVFEEEFLEIELEQRERKRKRRAALDISSLTMQNYSEIFRAVPMGHDVKMVGGQRMKGTVRTVEPMKYVKCNSRFVKHVVGSLDTTEGDDFLHVGMFNPVEILNAQYVLKGVAYFLDESSSNFLNMGTTQSLPIARQWDTPNPLNQYIAAGMYKSYNCEFVKAMVRFTNTHPTASIRVYWKVFYPGDQRVRNAQIADDFSFTVDNASLLALQADITHTVAGEGRVAINRLESVPGMMKIVLGPDSSNGPPNQGTAYFEINVKNILNSMEEPHVYSGTGTFLEAGFMPHVINSLTKTTAALTSFWYPTVHFWAMQIDDGDASATPGVISAVQADTDTASVHPLWAEGSAEYTVRLFGLDNEALTALDSDIT